jgi:hypothetical protein
MDPQTIELDCEPGRPRPDTLLPGVLEGTGLAPKEPALMWFGNWTFDYSEVPAEEWKRIQAITKPRIESLYREGRIRYGSW